MTAEQQPGCLAWVDCEWTASHPADGHLAEVGLVITTPDLDVLDRRSVVLHVPATHWGDLHGRGQAGDETAALIHAMHEASGLIEETLDPRRPGAWTTDAILAGYVRSRSPRSPMCGSSVHWDRAWLGLHMPKLADTFTHRNIDVSTIKELVARWRPDLAWPGTPTPKTHRVLDDLNATLDEARHYRRCLFDGTGALRAELDATQNAAAVLAVALAKHTATPLEQVLAAAGVHDLPGGAP